MHSLRKHRQTLSWLIVAAVLVATAGTALAAGEDDGTVAPVEPDATTNTTAPPPTTFPPPDPAPSTTVGGVVDGGTIDGGTTPTEPAPTSTANTSRKRRYRCKRGINACNVAKRHQRHGHFQGSRGHKWKSYRREAKLLRYAKAVKKAKARAKRLRKKRIAVIRRWAGVAQCESGRNWKANTGNGYYGGLQFSKGTWGWPGYPHQYPAWKQAQRAEQIRVGSGLHHWPHCGRYYG